MADKIDQLKIGNTSYDIDLPPDATPSIASLTVSGDISEGGTSLVNKYLGKSAKAADSDTVDNYHAEQLLVYAKYKYHDIAAFCNAAVPVYEVSADGSTGWTETTLNKDIFAAKENFSFQVTNTSQKGARFTWKAGIVWSSINYAIIGWTYQATPATVTLKFESSADSGSTWTDRGTTTDIKLNSTPALYGFSSPGGDTWFRVSIIQTSETGSKNISTIKLLTSRWGDQGLGSEYEKPYASDGNKTVRPWNNGTQLLGTSSAKWKEIHGVTIYENGTSLASKYYLASNPNGYTTNTGTVIGSELTADYFIVGNGTVNVKTSTMKPTTSSTTWSTTSDVNVPTMKAISSYVTGLGYTTNTGTVTSVAMTVPTGLSISGSPITSSGTLAVTFTSGYSLPTTAKQNAWDGKQAQIAKTGSTTKPVYFSAAGTVAACTDYAGGTALTLNGTSKAGATASIYAPTSVGTDGQLLSSNGSSLVWTNDNRGLLQHNLVKIIENTTTDKGWKMFTDDPENDPINGFFLRSLRFNSQSPAWGVGDYGAGIVFGGGDTKGVMSVSYGNPQIKIAGGNGNFPVWWIKLTGTSEATYNLNKLNSLGTQANYSYNSSTGTLTITTL